jgi:ABC-type polysaccharide/polyol phosphate export permease
MINFLRQARYSYKGLFIWRDWPSYVTTVVFGPAFTIVMFSLVGRFAIGSDVVRPYVLGLVAQYIPFIISATILQCIVHERSYATLSVVYASRVNRTMLYFSRQVCHIPNGFAVVAAGLITAWLLLGIDFSQVNWPGIIVSVLCICLSSSACASFFGNFTIVFTDWILMYRVFAGVIIVMTGVIIPLASFPTPLAVISRLMPLTSGLVAFRSAFDGAGIAGLVPSLLGELAVFAGYTVLGLAGSYVSEEISKRRGILETTA